MKNTHIFVRCSGVAARLVLATTLVTSRIAAQAPLHAPAQVARQDSLPALVTLPVPRETSLPLTTAIDQWDNPNASVRLVDGGHYVERRDSIRVIVDSLARAWVSQLSGHAHPRFHVFAMAGLHLRAGQDAEAQRVLASWIDAPGISAAERVWLLQAAAGLVLNAPHDPSDPPVTPGHLAMAQHYLAQLEAMPFDVSAMARFGVLSSLQAMYLFDGQSDSALVYGRRAWAIPPKMTDVRSRLTLIAHGSLMDFAMAMAKFPDHYVRTTDSLLAILEPLAAAQLPAAELQKAGVAGEVEEERRNFTENTRIIRMIGRPAFPIIGTHWYNQTAPTLVSDAAPGARELRFGDGVIHVIGFGFFTCGHCGEAMKDWEQFQHELPTGVQCLWYERSEGFFGNEVMEPDVEAEHLRHNFVERAHYTYPIVVWAGPRVKNEEGGSEPMFSPTMGHYGFWGGPHFIVVDGRGIYRHRISGWNKKELVRVLNQLAKEHAQETHHAS